MKRLYVHPKNAYLMWEDESPFFYLADTAWELFHKLSREEAEQYLTVRAGQGFTAVQAVALAEFDGLSGPNYYGRVPLHQKDGRYDPLLPDTEGGNSYWDHVDYIVKAAARLGLFIALLPTWGDKYNLKWGKGPEIFNAENAYQYGKWIGTRYCEEWNIIWMLGGDRPLENELHHQIIDAMAQGIREADPNHLITFHPSGESSSVQHVPDRQYIDFHGIQSGHGTNGLENWRMLRRTMQTEAKPCLDLEPRYEDHPICFKPEYGMWNCDDVRQNAYWALMEGVCGHTYGNHCVWSMNTQPTDYYRYCWTEVLHHPGAEQMRHVKALRLSRPYFEFRPAPELIADDHAVMAHQCAARGERYAFAYSPLGQPMRMYLQFLCTTAVKASWFDPRTGEEQFFAVVPPRETLFAPPTSGKGRDWVLVLDVLETS